MFPDDFDIERENELSMALKELSNADPFDALNELQNDYDLDEIIDVLLKDI